MLHQTTMGMGKKMTLPSNIYIDIHSHSPSPSKDVITFCSLFHDQSISECENTFFSVGLHPWHIDSTDCKNALLELDRSAQSEDIIAIGETGLDRAITTKFERQKKVLKEQLRIAEKYNKPLLIHCVRAFPEIISLLKKSKVPIIIHGFQGNFKISDELLKHNFYISIGAAILKEIPKHIHALQLIPLENLFLETDESDESIKTIYAKVSELLEVEEKELMTQIQANTTKLFHL